MMLQSVIDCLEKINYPIVVWSEKNLRIKLWNKAAEERFHRIKERALLDYPISEDAARWYDNIARECGNYDFRPVRMLDSNEEKLLCSAFVGADGDTLRIDFIEPINDQEILSYFLKLEFASEFQNWAYSRDIKTQVDVFLKAALYVYGGDRAYIFEVDPDNECLVDLYSMWRSEMNEQIATIRSIGEAGIRDFMRIWETGESIMLAEYNKNDVSTYNKKLFTQLYKNLNSWNSMIVPFNSEGKIRCFFAIDNVRCFFGKDSILRQLAQMASSRMYAEHLSDVVNSSNKLSSSIVHIPENQIRINAFGGLSISSSRGIETDSNFYSSQCGIFFLYLLCNRKRSVPVRELAEILCPDELIDSPSNMIKSVAFRTRKMLDNICSKPIIVSGKGTYNINKELDIWLDAEEFESKCLQAREEGLPEERRIELYSEAFDLYKGAMLPNYDSEAWLNAQVSYFQLLYIELVRGYIKLLDDKNDYIKMFSIVGKANEIEYIDSDIHMQLLRSLLRNKRWDYAKKYYLKVKDKLEEEENAEFRKLWKNRK